MKPWIKTGLLSSFVSLLIVAAIFLTGIFKFLGVTDLKLELFYGLCFLFLAYFMGNVTGVMMDEQSAIEIGREPKSKYPLLFFNGMAFFVVLGFGFSLEVFKETLKNNYAFMTIGLFFILGVVIMSFVVLMAKYKTNLLFSGELKQKNNQA